MTVLDRAVVAGDATPVRPRAVRSRKNPSHFAPSSAEVTLQAEDLPVPVRVHPGREQGVLVHDAAAFADLQHQGVRRDSGPPQLAHGVVPACPARSRCPCPQLQPELQPDTGRPMPPWP